MNGYIIVNEDVLDIVAEVTQLPQTFWERELKRIENYPVNLVVFGHEGEIKQVSIDMAYNVAFVMKQKFGLEPYSGHLGNH